MNSSPFLCAAKLIPLRKKDGSVRPIAVGETLRRIVGKALLKTPEVAQAVRSLMPRQVRVGVPNATELIGMGIQRIVDSSDPKGDWVILQVDVQNAYNTLSRTAILEGCATKVSGAYNWMAFSYAQHVPLYCQGQLLCWSQKGVHQGDACGPLGFALGLQMALDKCEALSQQLAWNVWYLDDGTVVGKATEVYTYLNGLEKELSAVGLRLNPAKCKLWGPGVQTASTVCPHYPEGLPLDHVARAIPVTAFAEGHGLTTLGVPADAPGSTTHTATKWKETVDKTDQLLKQLEHFPTSQVRHALLRYCLDACKVTHLLRSTDSRKAQSEVQRLSSLIRRACDDLVGMSVSDAAWQQMTLPFACSGIGVKDPLQVQPIARISAITLFERLGRDRVGIPEIAFERPFQDLQSTINGLHAGLGPNFEPVASWKSDNSKVSSAEYDHTKQDWWAEKLSIVRLSALMSTGPIRDMARMRCQQGSVANAWMQVLPSRALQTDLSNGDFQLLMRWWVGLPLFHSREQLVECPACGETSDHFGDHFVSCKKNGATERHNALRDVIHDICTRNNIPADKEQGCHDGTRDADVLLMAWNQGKHCALDVCFEHPLAPHKWPLNLTGVENTLRAAEATKRGHAEERCARHNWGYAGAAFSPWGMLGPGAAQFLHALKKKATNGLSDSAKMLKDMEITRGVSMTIARQVAKQLRLRNLVQSN